MPGSQIFQQNRALGYVSNHVKANVRYIERRKENIAITCVGKSFHTYACNSFRLIRVSGLHPESINCIAADSYLTYTACGKVIYGWRNSTELRKVYRGHIKNVHLLLPFGRNLISVDESSLLKIWNVLTEDVYLEIPFNNDNFTISAILHPASYKNKILLGSQQGGLQLWNIKDSKMVHTFKGFDSRIMVIEQAPAIDVAAIGMQNGKIVLLNLLYDEQVMELYQDWGPVTGISFRTDGFPSMATGSTNGQVVIWNLEEKVIASTLNAHNDSVTTVACFPNEPLLLTTSPDNSIKLWIFDLPDGGARLLRYREGHSAPPLCINYHGANGHHILSSGEDSSLRIFSTVSETLNRSMGIASYNRKASKKRKNKTDDPHKMPPITQFTSELTRDKEWDSIGALHNGLIMVTTWSFDKCKMGELKLVPAKYQNMNRTDFTATATALCLSHCGNFVTIGYSSGDVERFNIQSGIHRATYGAPAHKNPVRGIVADNLNQMIVTGGGADGLVKFWNFKGNVTKPIFVLNMQEGITLFRGHRESAMICAAMENFNVYIIDMDTKTIVRKFLGHNGSITDACFSPDSRWLITAGMDCVIKVWDIPSAYLIDQFKMPQICVSLSMSPTGDFLATAHVDYRGIYLWANRTLFSHIELRAVKPDAEPPMMDLPSTITDTYKILSEDQERMEILDNEDIYEAADLNYESPVQLSDDLITMSKLATSRWQNLLNLDVIKKRNRPMQPPKKPKSAPFFLPTVAGLDFQFDVSNANDENENTRIVKVAQIESLSDFGKVLKSAIQTDDFNKCVDHIMSLGPSMIDYEIKNITPIDGGSGSISIMLQFMRMIEYMFCKKIYFELAQSYLCLFLKYHGRTVAENQQLVDYLPKIEVTQNRGWNVIEDKLLYGIGVVSSLRNFTN